MLKQPIDRDIVPGYEPSFDIKAKPVEPVEKPRRRSGGRRPSGVPSRGKAGAYAGSPAHGRQAAPKKRAHSA